MKDKKYHFVYITRHKNGKYYVGRHSTDDLDDGYIGSGNWPLSIKDRSSMTREIAEFADNAGSSVLLEGKYLAEHYGKPGCMNATPNPVGWDSDNNPMKDPEIVAQLSGDNHWTRKNPEKVVSGDDHWLRQDIEARERFLENHPNKDGRNAKLAMERGTHINLTDNPSTQRVRNRTHQWFKDENGESVGSRTNEKRIEEGTHNWLGPEHNKKLVDDGTHNLLGSSQNERMLAEGKHPSQQKVTCSCCSWTVSVGMFKRWHSEGRCHMNPSSSRYNPNLKQR
jgi:hypothetical protein